MPTFELIHKRDEWDQQVLRLPRPHALQSWDWGQVKSRWGWQVERLLWRQQAQPVAAAQVLARPIPYLPWRLLYVPKGPILDYGQTDLAEKILVDLESYARQKQALFIKIDPDVVRQYGEPAEERPPEPVGQAILELLEQHRWRFSPEQIQFRNTVVIDLTSKPEALLADMKSKWRYNIRLAGRRGVEIRRGDEQDITAFYRMYAETAARDGFLIRPEGYYQEVWSRFLAAGQAEMLLAAVEEELVAGLIMFVFGESAWYMYGASTGQHRNLMPNHLLQWRAMRRAQERGCRRYDMWGAPDTFDESNDMWGVYRFKQGFGGEVVQGLGAFDYPVRPALYWAFSRLMPRLRALLRRVSGG